MQRIQSFIGNQVGARHAGEGTMEFFLVAGSVGLAAFIFFTALVPMLVAASH